MVKTVKTVTYQPGVETMLVSHPLAGLLIGAAEQPVPVSAQALPLLFQEGHLLRGHLKGKRSAVRLVLLIMVNNPPPWYVIVYVCKY